MSETRKGKPCTRKKNKDQIGEKNSQFGKKWYTNGIESMTYLPGTQPEGWRFGTMNGDKFKGDNNPAKRPEVREKISKALKGKLKPEYIGEGNPFYNKKHTDETRRKMSAYWANRRKEKIENS